MIPKLIQHDVFVSIENRELLQRASYKLAGVQATLQNKGEAINDDARVAAHIDLEEVREALVVVMTSKKK